MAEQYVAAFSKLAKESNTIMLPSNTGRSMSLFDLVYAFLYFYNFLFFDFSD